jgi:hypothetical protein
MHALKKQFANVKTNLEKNDIYCQNLVYKCVNLVGSTGQALGTYISLVIS